MATTEVSELAERQAKLEGENKQIDHRISNAEQNQRTLRTQMDDKFEILLGRMDSTFNELRQDNQNLANRLDNRMDSTFNELRQDNQNLANRIDDRIDNALSELRRANQDLANRMHKDFKWLMGAILGTGILLKIIDKVW